MLSINEYRLTQIKRHFGISVSESTWKRWRRWWRDTFVETAFWKKTRALIPESERSMPLVRRLLRSFQGELDNKIILLLKLISPITAGHLRAV